MWDYMGIMWDYIPNSGSPKWPLKHNYPLKLMTNFNWEIYRMFFFFFAGDFHRSARRLRKSISVVFQDCCSAHGWVQINSRNVELLKEWLCCVKDERTRPCCGVPSWTTSWLDTWQKSVPIFMKRLISSTSLPVRSKPTKNQILVFKNPMNWIEFVTWCFPSNSNFIMFLSPFCSWPYPNTTTVSQQKKTPAF